MLRTHHFVCLSAALLLLLSACSEERPDIMPSTPGGGSDEAEQWLLLGVVCEGDDDCDESFTCSGGGTADGTARRADDQCSVRCATDEECHERFGDRSTCLVESSVCARSCTDLKSCSPGTFCASDGWCERPGPATTDTHCGGTPTATCAEMSNATCALLRGCGATDTCSGTRVGACGSHHSAESCALQMGCVWEAGGSDACVGYPEPLPCASAPTPSSCAAAGLGSGNCVWKTGNCAGTPNGTCPGVGTTDCELVPGCAVVSH